MAISCDASFNSNGATIGIYIPNICSRFKKIEAKNSLHAEKLAIMWAMRIAWENGIVDTVYTDCKAVVMLLKKDGNSGSKTVQRIKQMMRNKGFKVKWVPRTSHKIRIADKISRR